MAEPDNPYLGRGRYANGSFDTDEPVAANPAAMRTYANDAPDTTATVRTMAGEAGTALSSYRTSALMCEAGFRHRAGIDWDPSWTDAAQTGRSATDALADLCDDVDHLDTFVGSVADAIFRADGLDPADPGADQVVNLTVGDIEAHGVGFPRREDAINQAQDLAEEFENFNETTTVEELEEWGDAVAVIQHDTAGSVTLVEGLGAGGLEQLPDLLLADGEVPRSTIDTTRTSLETALDTLPRDEPWEHTNPDNQDLPFDQRLSPTLHNNLLDNPDALLPYTDPTTHNINRTLGRADARSIEHIIGDLDDGLATVTEGSGFDMQPDEDELAELAELYPELATVFGNRPSFLQQNEYYSGAMTTDLGPDDVRTLADLTNTFGLAFDQDLIVSIEGHDGPMHRAGEHDVALTGTHGDDGPFVYFVEPFANVLGTADRTGHLDDDARDALVTVAPPDARGDELEVQELAALRTQRERANVLIGHGGDFSAETTASLADNAMASHRERLTNSPSEEAYWNFDDLEGFTSEDFLTSSDDRQPLASNDWAIFDIIDNNPEAAGRFYSNPENVTTVLSWASTPDIYSDAHQLAADRLDVGTGDIQDTMQQTAANSLDHGLGSDDPADRAMAMGGLIAVIPHVYRPSSDVGNWVDNPHLYEIIVDHTVTNIHALHSIATENARPNPNGTSQGELSDAATFLSIIMEDESARHDIRTNLHTYAQNQLSQATSDEEVRGIGFLYGVVDQAEIELYDRIGREEMRSHHTIGDDVDWFVSFIPRLSDSASIHQGLGGQGSTLGDAVDRILNEEGPFDALTEADQSQRIVTVEARLSMSAYVVAENFDSNSELQDLAEGEGFLHNDGSLMTLNEMHDNDVSDDFAAWILSEELWGNPVVDGEAGPLWNTEMDVNMDRLYAGRMDASDALS